MAIHIHTVIYIHTNDTIILYIDNTYTVLETSMHRQ